RGNQGIKGLTIDVIYNGARDEHYEFYHLAEGSFNYLIPKYRHIPGNTASDESLFWARQRLQSCLGQHNACPNHEETILPRRVLDLGLSTNTDDYTGDLKLRQALDERSPYFCLSYC
ncbi:hypothetical protein M430DRAFT_144239, partial [Amorphotheca resinae ATCC 22711]